MNLFDLFVTIGVKDEATGPVSQIKATTVAAGHLMADAAKAAGGALVNLGKQAIAGYAETEQLLGGVETLYGQKYKSAEEYAEKTGSTLEFAMSVFDKYSEREQTILDNAKNAYKTAGMSANEYMETVNGFAASLTSSLGKYEWQAANYAEMIVTDMADNSNKMGTSMESIQNAYSGFAKQNFTMLDNLKLGYGGTKEEMQRLLNKAEELAGYEFGSLDINSFADVAEAIHIVQEEMGITGTTAAEAAGTISGSVATMKAAWKNLVVGFADGNADIDELLGTFMDSVKTVAGNVLPVVEKVLSSIFSTLEENGPEMIASGVMLLAKLALGVVKAIPDIVAKIPEIVTAIVSEFKASGPEFASIGKDIVRGIWSGIQSLASWVGGKVKGFLGDLVDGAKDLLGIHSPSTVFAGMGENMVLGLEKGWDDNISHARKDIESGLDFGTASVNYGSSAMGRARSAVGNGISGDPITIVVQSVLDGRVIGETAYKYNREKERAFGW